MAAQCRDSNVCNVQQSAVTMGFRRKFKKCRVKPAQTLGRPSPPPHSSLRKVIESPPGHFFQTVDVCRCTPRRSRTQKRASVDECFPLTLDLVCFSFSLSNPSTSPWSGSPGSQDRIGNILRATGWGHSARLTPPDLQLPATHSNPPGGT